jgi:hypothetical protein
MPYRPADGPELIAVSSRLYRRSRACRWLSRRAQAGRASICCDRPDRALASPARSGSQPLIHRPGGVRPKRKSGVRILTRSHSHAEAEARCVSRRLPGDRVRHSPLLARALAWLRAERCPWPDHSGQRRPDGPGTGRPQGVPSKPPRPWRDTRSPGRPGGCDLVARGHPRIRRVLLAAMALDLRRARCRRPRTPA